ncbi:MAG: T9SS type A sorting domain-containing protein [Saprospiraceae bacterium]|nr:T9SS type A sorting domain-containing protein [Saprospiraceae bacterium]
MTHLFGEGYSFSDSTYATTHGVRSFTDFESCAQETAISRLYGGIHYDFGNQNGSYLGRTVGDNIINLFQQVSSTAARQQLLALQIFPNPAKDAVFIKNMTPSMTSFKLSSITGSTMKSGMMDSNGISLDGLAPGLYIVTILDSNGYPVGQQKLVVQ